MPDLRPDDLMYNETLRQTTRVVNDMVDAALRSSLEQSYVKEIALLDKQISHAYGLMPLIFLAGIMLGAGAMLGILQLVGRI